MVLVRNALFLYAQLCELCDSAVLYEEVEYEKPEVILDKIEALEDQIKANVVELRKLLKQS
jgi:hypothetical protein